MSNDPGPDKLVIQLRPFIDKEEFEVAFRDAIPSPSPELPTCSQADVVWRKPFGCAGRAVYSEDVLGWICERHLRDHWHFFCRMPDAYTRSLDDV